MLRNKKKMLRSKFQNSAQQKKMLRTIFQRDQREGSKGIFLKIQLLSFAFKF
jgi:hypothetical protein